MGPGLPYIIGLNLCIAGIYTNFAVNLGGSWAPGIPVLGGALLLLPHVFQNRNLFRLVSLAAFLILSLIAGGSGMEFFDTRVPSFIQMVVALGCAHIILSAMRYPETVRKTLFAWLIFIVIGVILESVYLPFRELSDSFRSIAYAGRFIYDADVRDLRDYGFVRPKLFTQEPSHVAKAFLVCGTGWYVLSSSRKRLSIILVLTLLLTLFLGSPLVLMLLPLAWFIDRIASGHSVSNVVAAGIPVLGMLMIFLTQFFSSRLALILSGHDNSFFARFLGPYEVAIRSLEENPVFGIGIGAKESLRELIFAVYSPYYDARWLGENYLLILSNAFANSLTYFGIAGAALFYFLIVQWAKSFDITPLVSLPVVLLFFQLDGALEGLRMWGSIAVVLGCYAMARKDYPNNSAKPVTDPRYAERVGRNISTFNSKAHGPSGL